MQKENGRCYTIGQFQHEKDSKLITDVLKNEWVDKIFQWMEKEHIEELYRGVYEASCIPVSDKNAPEINNMVRRACEMFGQEELPSIYLYRNYDKSVEVCGLNKPFLLMSSDFLETVLKDDPEMLFGIIAGQIAGIRAGHNRGMMLFWAMETVLQYFPIPNIVLKGLDALLNEWNRCRFYTYDRAFFLATGNYPLALRSLLVYQLPQNILDQLLLGTPEDRYLCQAERFGGNLDEDDVIKMMNSLRSDDPWIPERYKELKKLYQEM